MRAYYRKCMNNMIPPGIFCNKITKWVEVSLIAEQEDRVLPYELPLRFLPDQG